MKMRDIINLLEGTNGAPYFVLIKDGEAQVLPEASFREIRDLESNGWEIVWDSANTPEEGYNHAAKMHGAWRADLEDKMSPQRMKEAKVLYRSVSIPELLDIFERGSITGRRNEFNDFDRRPYVFFADKMNANVIFQGEEIERQAAMINTRMKMRDIINLIESQKLSHYPLDDRDGWYSDADYEARGGKIIQMTPDEYLAKVRPLDLDDTSRENIDDLKNHMASGRKLDPLKIYADGKEDGRHRAHAAKEMGIREVPVIVFEGFANDDGHLSLLSDDSPRSKGSPGTDEWFKTWFARPLLTKEAEEHVTSSDELDENVIVSNLSERMDFSALTNGAVKIGDLSGMPLWRNEFPDYHQEAYLIIIDGSVKSYIVLENRDGFWWLLEVWTSSDFRKRGAARALIKFAVSEKIKVVVDRELTTDSAQMIEKMLSKGDVQGSLANLKTGQMTPFAITSGIGVYNSQINGIDRSPISTPDANQLTWVLENRRPRLGVLSEYIRFGPVVSEGENHLGEIISESFELDATPLSDEEIRAAKLPPNVQAKLFANRDLEEGRRVAIRLNLNGKVGGYFLQTVHDRTASGTALGYDGAVTVRNATFSVSQRARELIASKQENKFPMAAVIGSLSQVPAELSGTEIRFNPMASHLFEDLNGHAVKSAEEVTVFNTRCFARGKITYWAESEAPKALGDIPSATKFVA